MEETINIAQTMNSIELSQQTNMAVMSKAKEVMEQQGEAALKLINAVPTPEGNMGHNVDIKV